MAIQDGSMGDANGAAIATSGAGDMAAQPLEKTAKSASLLKHTAAELLGSIGFVSMFAAIGSALIPLLAGTAVMSTAAALTTAGIGLAIGITAIATSQILKSSMHKEEEIEKEAREKEHAQPTQVIINNLQVQPNVDIETSTKVFTKMIEAERAQAQQNPGPQK